jgi:FMN phosphatase YigB (HAD superfamily)
MLRSALQTAPEACRASLVVLDFDGTLTDADAHAAAFHEASGRELARRLGWDEPTLRRERQRAVAATACLPPTAAWTVNGRGVCPVAADPYLIANTVTKLLIAEHRPGLDDASLVAKVLEVHHAAYASTPPPFRPDARSLLEELCRRDFFVRVVTNSHTPIVSRLLDSLSFQGRERVTVQGGANKFVVCGTAVADPRFESLPETADWPELGRLVHLRRGRYFDVLRQIWDETATGPESALVVGDIFELDLAMPAALGTHVHLVTRSSTLPHERRLTLKMARGDAAGPLAAVLDRILA